MHIEIIDPIFSSLSGVICIGLPMTSLQQRTQKCSVIIQSEIELSFESNFEINDKVS